MRFVFGEELGEADIQQEYPEELPQQPSVQPVGEPGRAAGGTVRDGVQASPVQGTDGIQHR